MNSLKKHSIFPSYHCIGYIVILCSNNHPEATAGAMYVSFLLDKIEISIC